MSSGPLSHSELPKTCRILQSSRPALSLRAVIQGSELSRWPDSRLRLSTVVSARKLLTVTSRSITKWIAYPWFAALSNAASGVIRCGRFVAAAHGQALFTLHPGRRASHSWSNREGLQAAPGA